MIAIRLQRSFLLALLLSLLCLPALAQNRWTIQPDGGIAWEVKNRDAHADNIEMAGRKVAVIVNYAVNNAGRTTMTRHVVFPMLRFLPHGTRMHLAMNFSDEALPRVIINGAAPREATTRIYHKGIMRIDGQMTGRDAQRQNYTADFMRSIFPSTTKAAVYDQWTITNRTEKDMTIEIDENTHTIKTPDTKRSVYGVYVVESKVQGGGEKTLKPGESLTYTMIIDARKAAEPEISHDVVAEQKAREERVASLFEKLRLETPDPVLNTMFAFAKIRAAESIYETKGGLMHGPGGGAYYAAIWANDQAEYANPFFAYLGDATATESAINAYRHFAKYMNPEYKPIPSSIVAEGEHFWHGAGDRGDMAMIAYGASRFALANGDKKAAEELWPLIEWCLEYDERKINNKGVVASDSDELENRFPSGLANLCTSSLHYDALNSAALLGIELGKPKEQTDAYLEQAVAMKAAIESYFGATVEGFETYRYYDKQDTLTAAKPAGKFKDYANRPDALRAWICIPLTVDIFDRTKGTIEALFSPRLWTEDGLATEAGDKTFWDRATLYGLRGALAAGETKQGMDFLKYYSNRRLLGDHVPYAVEAYPEGNQRHLSAESALYARIFTEGLFGIRPTGFHAINIRPQMPEGWNEMALRNVHGFGGVYDFVITREGNDDKLKLEIMSDGKVVKTVSLKSGQTAKIDLAG